MSELKSHDLVDIQDYRGEVYIKSEADKVIAEKDKEITELKEQVYDYALGSYVMQARAEKEARHEKHKRCLAMADMCSEALCYWDNVKYSFFKGEAYCFRKMNHYGKCGQIWIAISEKFKEKK